MSVFPALLLACLLADSPARVAVPADAPAVAAGGAVTIASADTPLMHTGSDSDKARESENILGRYVQASGAKVVRGLNMAAMFAGSLPKLGKSATVSARRLILRDGTVNYEITARQGDTTVWKEIILRFINAEMENAGKDNRKVAVTPENYKFKYKGERERDGRTVYVFEVNPRKKRQGLFKGEIWIDTETALTVYETGRFVKSPSVFLKRVQFSREYAILDGMAVPKTLQTSIETRFWGLAELDIQFSDFRWDDPLLALD
jgi:hypothetical protein